MKKRNFSVHNERGQSIIQALVAVAIGVAAVFAITSVISTLLRTQAQSNFDAQVSQLRNSLYNIINNGNAWQATYQNNTALACINAGTTCLTPGGAPLGNPNSPYNLTPYPIDVFDSGGKLFYQGTNAAAGFTTQGGSCTTFKTPPATGDSNCPLHFNVTWYAVCSAPCIYPQSKINIQAVYNPGPGRSFAFNPANYSALNFFQGQAFNNALGGGCWIENASGLEESPTCGDVGIGTTAPVGDFDVFVNASHSISVDPTTGDVGIGTTGAKETLAIVGLPTALGDMLSIRSTNPNAWSSMSIYDSGNTIRGFVGYGNAGVGGSWPGITYFSSENGAPLALGTMDGPRLYIDGGAGLAPVPGAVGIGTTQPVQQLDVVTNIAGGGVVSVQNKSVSGWSSMGFYSNTAAHSVAGTTAEGFIGYGNANVGDAWKGIMYVTSNLTAPLGLGTNDTPRLLITSTGLIGIGTMTPAYALDVVGDIQTSGCVHYASSMLGTCSSDERLKKDIRPFDLGLDVVLGMKPKYFKYNGLGGERESMNDQLGVIAQDIEKVAPSLITKKEVKLHPDDEKETTIKTVDYGSFIYVVINAIKEVYGDLTDLKTRVTVLEKENVLKEEKIRALEQRLDAQAKDIAALKRAGQLTSR